VQILLGAHPSEIKDMSLGLQALMSEYIVKNKKNLKSGMVDVPPILMIK
jgi:S-adenosylhomocysteine hydrolase